MSLKIIFMGTPDFAVPSLKALLEKGYSVPAVITAPDKPAGRGQKIHFSAIKEFVMAYNESRALNEDAKIKILQPEKLKNPEFLELLESFKADLQIVVAFRMLPKVIWDMPPLGTFNLHGSLLPQYRGAAPINWAIMNGEKVSGVTTFFLNEEIDAGKIIFREELPIGDAETFGEYYDRLKIEGAKLVLKTVDALEKGLIESLPEIPVSNERISLAPKLDKTTGFINWKDGAEKIYNLIRGLSPFPTAFTYWEGKIFKIFLAEREIISHSHIPGTLETDGKSFLRFYTPDGFITALDVQMENKKRMKTTDLLRGYRLSPGFYEPNPSIDSQG